MLVRERVCNLGLTLSHQNRGFGIGTQDLIQYLAQQDRLCTMQDVTDALITLANETTAVVVVADEIRGGVFWRIWREKTKYTLSGPWNFGDGSFNADEEIVYKVN